MPFASTMATSIFVTTVIVIAHEAMEMGVEYFASNFGEDSE